MDRKYQTYESHIPYLHQFFIDHNLFGMDYIHLKAGRFRMPVYEIPREAFTATEDPSQFFTNASIPSDHQWHAHHGVHRQSYTELELDVSVAEITNRLLIKERPRKALIDVKNGTQSFGDTKLVPSLATIWQDEERRRQTRGLPNDLFASTPGDGRLPYIPWTNEERMRNILRKALDDAGM
ncbi:DNA polymerase zeta, partial [Rhizophlyctis rosea]